MNEIRIDGLYINKKPAQKQLDFKGSMMNAYGDHL